MGTLNKALVGLCVALALGLLGTLAWGLYASGEAKVQENAAEAATARADALEGQAKAQVKTDPAQATQRGKARHDVQVVLDSIHKEEQSAQEPRPVGSATQLDRLRRLTEATNAGIRAARVLP